MLGGADMRNILKISLGLVIGWKLLELAVITTNWLVNHIPMNEYIFGAGLLIATIICFIKANKEE